MESADLAIEQIPDESTIKFQFALKLWVATNSRSVEYLRWNRNRTVLIIDVEKMEKFWLTHIDPIFLCDNKATFLWLLYQNGFESCTGQVLDADERKAIDPEKNILVRHPQFVGSNVELFNEWIALSSARKRQDEVKGNCTLPTGVKFATNQNFREFDSFRRAVVTRMEKLDTELWQLVNTANEQLIREKYPDRPVLDVTYYGKRIEGFYGPVKANELADCLGDLLPKKFIPKPSDDEEVIVVEDD